MTPVVQIYRYMHSGDHMPTPSGASSLTAPAAAAGSESPKRKYTEAMTNRERLPTLSVDTSEIENNNRSSDRKCDSPRSKVAEKLQALDIEQTDDAPRKRVKRVGFALDDAPSRPDLTPDHSLHLHRDVDRNGPEPIIEIAETPGCRPDSARLTTPSPLAKKTGPAAASAILSPRVIISPKRLRSPPPPVTAASIATTTNTNSIEATLASSQDPTEDSAMTWQDSEITGHEIHSSLGDDGEGINGIGFRPTPAIAQARSQKRKHQLSEWRAREAREARQRRFEKRQGCSVDVAGGDESQRRLVRFEEIG